MDDSPQQYPNLAELASELREFAKDRDWEQFHSPKNLSMALAVEAAELMEIFQWRSGDEDLASEELASAGAEVADILIYLTRFADVAGINLTAAVTEKLIDNGRRYPADEVRGSSAKR